MKLRGLAGLTHITFATQTTASVTRMSKSKT